LFGAPKKLLDAGPTELPIPQKKNTAAAQSVDLISTELGKLRTVGPIEAILERKEREPRELGASYSGWQVTGADPPPLLS